MAVDAGSFAFFSQSSSPALALPFIIVGFSWLIMGVICAIIWSSKEGSIAFGFVLGFFLSFIGLILVIAMQPRDRRVPTYTGGDPYRRIGAKSEAPSQTTGAVPTTGPQVPIPGPAMPVPSVAQPVATGPMVPAPGYQPPVTRVCPHCSQSMTATERTCPACKQQSSPWRSENGSSVTLGEDGKEWRLESTSNTWVRYRTNKFCPHCMAEMQPAQIACPECGNESNALTGF